MNVRRLELTPARLERWWARFHDEHPHPTWEIADGRIVLSSTDGTRATFHGWFPPEPGANPTDTLARVPRNIVIVLVRRGGYSIGVATGGTLTAHKTGTRYVQGRTAAGGWSQQRFARRRDNQTSELVESAQAQVRRLLPSSLSPDAGLVLGGDEQLARQVLAHPELISLVGLPRREFWDIPDPRFTVLEDVIRRTQMVPVTVINP